MAEVSNLVINKKWKDKLVTVKEFCNMHKGLSFQAVTNAVKSGKIDYIKVGDRKMIVLTEKTLKYRPNKSERRSVMHL